MDRDLELVKRGQMSGLLKAEVQSRLLAREQSVVNKLIGKYHSDQLTGEDARAGIAALAELRGLFQDLTRDARLGQDASERLMKSGQPTGTRQEE